MPEFSSTAWLIIGLGLIIAEIFSLTLVLLFFGCSALVVALLKVFGLNDLKLEWMLFAVIGLAALLIFRRRIRTSLATTTDVDIDRNATFALSTDVPANGEATVLYQGTNWTAVNRGTDPLPANTTVRIVSTQGIKLIVERV